MFDFSAFYQFVGQLLPFSLFQAEFMVRALIGLSLLAPMAAMMGVQVVNSRMAFFADAISHTSFAGVAVGLLLGISPYWSMPLVALLIGAVIVWSGRKSRLSEDSLTGVVFSGVVAFGLAIVSRYAGLQRDAVRFLYGDILTISDSEILFLLVLFLILILFQFLSYNKLLYIGLNSVLAKSHRVRVAFFQYAYALFLVLVIVLSVWWVGVLLVTGLLIIPAATARNFSKSAGAMFWYAVSIGFISAVVGLVLSAQPWARTATGATIVLVSLLFFIFSYFWRSIKK